MKLEKKISDLHTIGEDQPIFTIAEIGLNHNNDIKIAKKMIDVAKNSGFSSVKFQNFSTDDVYVGDGKSGKYQLLGKEIDIYNLHKDLEISFEMLTECKKYSESKGMDFFSAPIGMKPLQSLIDLNVNLIKISSYEISDIPFVTSVAETKIPVIMSTGAATLAEVDNAINVISKFHENISLMHCITKYPADFNEANLNAMRTLKAAFGLPVGFSNNGFRNHQGKIDYLEVPTAAAKLGCDLYEVHITLDRSMEGVDQGFSCEPGELEEMITSMKSVRSKLLNGESDSEINDVFLGSGKIVCSDCERYVRDFAYKSIYAIKDIKKGEKISQKNIKCLRPGEHVRGLEPKFYNLLISEAKASHDIKAFQPIEWTTVLY